MKICVEEILLLAGLPPLGRSAVSEYRQKPGKSLEGETL